jgi:hypothetical protein
MLLEQSEKADHPRVQNNETDLGSVIDSVLNALGRSSKRALYYYLEREYGVCIRPHEPLAMKHLMRSLTSLLGCSGAQIILDMINKQLQRTEKCLL